MTTIDLLVDAMSQSQNMFKMHLADFSDADMLVRPVPGANHTAWQLGHLVNAESSMVNQCAPGAIPPSPAGFAEKFTKEKSKIDDPSAFATKAEILAAFDKGRAATIAWARTLSAADLDKPTPEKMRGFVATFGNLLTLIPTHDAMHLGQIQVIRRKLGKPVLF